MWAEGSFIIRLKDEKICKEKGRKVQIGFYTVGERVTHLKDQLLKHLTVHDVKAEFAHSFPSNKRLRITTFPDGEQTEVESDNDESSRPTQSSSSTTGTSEPQRADQDLQPPRNDDAVMGASAGRSTDVREDDL